ncbi:MAG: hypothetical protein ACXW1W_20430, partial [Methylococcaceae bacterium]
PNVRFVKLSRHRISMQLIGSLGSIFDDQPTVILFIMSGCFEFFQVAGLYRNRWLFSLLNIHEVSKWFVTPNETLNTPAL